MGRLPAHLVARLVSSMLALGTAGKDAEYCVTAALCVSPTRDRTDWGPALGGDGVVHYNSLPDINYAFGVAESKRSGEPDPEEEPQTWNDFSVVLLGSHPVPWDPMPTLHTPANTSRTGGWLGS